MLLKYLGKYYFNFSILCHYLEISYFNNFSIVEHVDKNFGRDIYPYFRLLYNEFLEVELVYKPIRTCCNLLIHIAKLFSREFEVIYKRIGIVTESPSHHCLVTLSIVLSKSLSI